MADRGPEGSAAYLRQPIPEDQWKDMEFDSEKKVWTAEIELDANASHIDFFSNNGKTLHYKTRDYRTYISSPYMRVYLVNTPGSSDDTTVQKQKGVATKGAWWWCPLLAGYSCEPDKSTRFAVRALLLWRRSPLGLNHVCVLRL